MKEHLQMRHAYHRDAVCRCCNHTSQRKTHRKNSTSSIALMIVYLAINHARSWVDLWGSGYSTKAAWTCVKVAKHLPQQVFSAPS